MTVPGNVNDSGYESVIKFARSTALLQLLTVALGVALTLFWMAPERTEWLLELTPERIWLACVVSFVLLALARSLPLSIQLPLFSVFLLSATAAATLWAPTIAEDFPDFAKALGCTLSAGWFGLFAYNLLAKRDYSFLGMYALVWLATVLATIVYTILSDIVFSLAFASLVVFSLALYYYVYDLSMILRRRRPGQVVEGALDLYRDALNFVGFPVRVMRMPRGLRRTR